MSSPLKNGRTMWVAALLAALVALPVVSQETMETPPLTAMRTTPGSVTWEPMVAYGKLTLTVQGGGFTTSREITGGSVHFAPVDPEGFQLPDGTYNWEIRMVPPAVAFNATLVRSDERRDGGRTQKKGTGPEPLVQSGSFTIAGGAIVDPGLTEPRTVEVQPDAERAAGDVDDSDRTDP